MLTEICGVKRSKEQIQIEVGYERMTEMLSERKHSITRF